MRGLASSGGARTAEGTSVMSNVTTQALVGRSGELRRLEALVQQVASGRGAVAVVEGEAGIGKSRLVREVLTLSGFSRFEVLIGGGDELERRRPFGVLADALEISLASGDGRRAAVAHLLHGDVTDAPATPVFTDTPEAEFRIAEAVLALVEEMCVRRPVALVVDDLQWVDPSSLIVLHRLARRLAQLPILLVVACRSGPHLPAVDTALRSLTAQAVEHLALGPLPPNAVAALAEATVQAPPGPSLLRQLHPASGNPLFVIELLAALRDQRAIHLSEDGQAEVAVAAHPPSLRLTILHRLSFLPDETLALLRFASILGSAFAVSDLSLLLGRAAVELAAPLEDCLAAGILREEGHRLAFRHELIRDALYQDLPQPVRAGLHRDAAQSLIDAGRPPLLVAEHLMRGAEPGDPMAVEWLQRAGREAATRAPTVAAELLGRALELAGPAYTGRETLLAEKALALGWSGLPREAERLCREGLERGHDPQPEIGFRTCLVQTLISTGRLDAALKEAEIASVSDRLSDAEQVAFQAWAALCRVSLGDFAGATDMALTARREADRAGEDLARCISTSVLAAANHFAGRFAEALSLADEAVSAADGSRGLEAHRFPVSIFRWQALVGLDHLKEADGAIQRGRAVSEQLGSRGPLPPYHWASAVGRFFSGDWDDAVTECEACAEVAEEIGLKVGILFSHALRAVIAYHRDLFDEAEEAVGAAERDMADTGPHQLGVDWMMWARALILDARGDPAGAVDVLSAAWDLCVAAGLACEQRVLAPDLVRLALAVDDRSRAEDTAAGVTALAEANPDVPGLTGVALRCRGLVDENADVLLQAVAACRSGPRPLELAGACADAAAALGSAGRLGEARALLENATSLYDGLGAVRDLVRTEGLARRLGVRRGSRGRRGRPKSGWESLTDTERNVLRLVAAGLSNPAIATRLFVSRHTVGTHVSHILAKLGLSSRVELAVEAARRGL